MKKNIIYKSVHHEATFTSDESAKARGEDLSIGGKAILMKVDSNFKLYVLSAAKKINSKQIKEFPSIATHFFTFLGGAKP